MRYEDRDQKSTSSRPGGAPDGHPACWRASMSAVTDDLALIEFLALLNERYGASVSYHRLWSAAVANRFPVQRIGGRIRARRYDVPKAAEALGLTRCQVVA